MFPIIASLVFLAVGLFSWYSYWFRYSRLLKRVTGPVPLPFIGHALKFPDSASIIPTFLSLIEKYGALLTLIIGLEPSITITDCEILEQVLNSNVLIHKSRQYKHLNGWLGTGLLTSGGSKWRKRRKIITPAYHFKILEQFVPIFNANADILMEQLALVEEKSDVDVYPFVTLCALDVICETAMGTSINAQINKTSNYVKSIKQLCRIQMDKTFKPHQQFHLLYIFTENYKREKKCLQILNEHTFEIIKNRRKEFTANSKAVHSNEFGFRSKVAFLDLLLQATVDGKQLSNEDIRDEVATFMFEGHDTTASAISFALYNIANNRHVLEKIMDEQMLIFSGDIADKSATYAELQEMKYLEMVIKETLRLYPSVPFYARETKEDLIINDELTLPKGITVNIFAYGVQRNPKFFPDPETFDPERFTLSNSSERHPYTYIPFSAGPRNCIGQKFAMLEMKSVLSKFVRHFHLKPSGKGEKMKLISEMILKSSNGVKIGIERRKN